MHMLVVFLCACALTRFRKCLPYKVKGVAMATDAGLMVAVCNGIRLLGRATEH